MNRRIPLIEPGGRTVVFFHVLSSVQFRLGGKTAGWARMDRYDPARDVTPTFLNRVTDWIERAGEVLVILRYLRAAVRKDFALCRTRSAFEDLIDSVPRGTDIEVFRDRQLPIRASWMMPSFGPPSTHFPTVRSTS